MKPLVSQDSIIVRGDVYKAKIVEVSMDLSLIVDFDGRLCRIVNNSNYVLQAGDTIRLKVSGINPIALTLEDRWRDA